MRMLIYNLRDKITNYVTDKIFNKIYGSASKTLYFVSKTYTSCVTVCVCTLYIYIIYIIYII